MTIEMKKNHELLGREWVWKLSFAERLESKRGDDDKFSHSATLNQRNAHIKSKLDLPVWQHLGFGVVPDLRAQMEMGVDLAVEYFWGDWWTAEGLDRLMTPEQQREYELDQPEKRSVFLTNNARAIDKNYHERELQWFTALQGGLFLGGLVGRWDDVAKICSWFDATIEPEYTAGTIEEQLFQWYICIAGNLSPEPGNGIDQLFQEVKKCRLKRPRLLCAAWEAVLAMDQATFDKAFLESVKHFVSKPSNVKIAYEWIAMDQSIIWLIAEHRGLQFPSMPEKCVAAVVTRQSLGLTD